MQCHKNAASGDCGSYHRHPHSGIQVAHQLFSMWLTGVKTAARSIAFSSGAKRAMFSSAASRRRANDGILRAKVLVVGSGRMGQIRSSLIYANPRFELCGIVDTNLDAARLLATTYQVLCVMRFISDSMIHCCQMTGLLTQTCE